MGDVGRREAAAALRALTNAFVAHDAGPELLERITAFADETTAVLRAGQRRDRAELLAGQVARIFDGGHREGVDRDGVDRDGIDAMSDRAVGGPTNPLSTEFDFEYQGQEAVVRTTLGPAYEGAPGRAHGGMVAAVFDDVTGFVLPLVGSAGYTGRLTIRYHRPVPVGTPLEFRARVGEREGRKVHVTADCHAEGHVVASADALFITVETGRFGQLLA